MAKLNDYPFSPHHEGKPEHFVGLHKLKAFRDDDPMKKILFELWCNMHGEKPEPEGTEDASGYGGYDR